MNGANFDYVLASASGFYYFVFVILWLDFFFFFQAEDGIRDKLVTGVQTCALPISTRAFGASGRTRVPRPLWKRTKSENRTTSALPAASRIAASVFSSKRASRKKVSGAVRSRVLT